MAADPTDSGRVAAFDGIRLVHRTWSADNPVAGVLVVHGLAEHGMRYGHVLDELLPAGVSVMTWDLRGHGLSGGRRGHCDRFDDYCDDVAMMIEFARDRLPSPLFLLAHSMGGLIVTRLAVGRGLKVDGVVLSNPALAVKMPVPAWKSAAAKGLSRLLPTLRMPSGVPANLISRDPVEVRKYIDDKLVFTDGTTRWGAEFLAAQAELVGASARFLVAPTLVQVGGADGITDPIANTDFFGSCGSDNCQVKVYPDAFHELYNEPLAERAPILADLREWIVGTAKA